VEAGPPEETDGSVWRENQDSKILSGGGIGRARIHPLGVGATFRVEKRRKRLGVSGIG